MYLCTFSYLLSMSTNRFLLLIVLYIQNDTYRLGFRKHHLTSKPLALFLLLVALSDIFYTSSLFVLSLRLFASGSLIKRPVRFAFVISCTREFGLSYCLLKAKRNLLRNKVSKVEILCNI